MALPGLERVAAAWWSLAALPAGSSLQVGALLLVLWLGQGVAAAVLGTLAGGGRGAFLERLLFQGALWGVAVALCWPRLEPLAAVLIRFVR